MWDKIWWNVDTQPFTTKKGKATETYAPTAEPPHTATLGTEKSGHCRRGGCHWLFAKKVAIVERWALVEVDCVLLQNIYSFGLFTAYRREFWNIECGTAKNNQIKMIKE